MKSKREQGPRDRPMLATTNQVGADFAMLKPKDLEVYLR